MPSKEFEDARKLQRLENQINHLNIELLNTNYEEQTKNTLKEILEETFSRYLALADQYRINSFEIKKINDIVTKHIK
ncbi:hypothetical protein BMS3Abin17_00295 [archaeon BMS3Abin17]|nr:hypothetical protein BMS3Abin17_00295 [archaeon BMS3Abin17]HDZ60374.1 hypothetical protein [Candidatus Pacearchaeota archaeon]